MCSMFINTHLMKLYFPVCFNMTRIIFCVIAYALIAGISAKHPRPARHFNISTTASPGSRIIGGSTSLPHQWPFMASIQFHDGYHFCGGVLIAQKWILTAAHCTEYLSAGDFRVVLGEHAIGLVEGAEQVINVSSVHENPFYNLQAPEHNFYIPYDLSLVELAFPANFNAYVKPIKLPSTCDVFVGQTCKIIGWGKMNRTSRQPSYLQEGNVNVISTFNCRFVWGSYVYYGSLCVFAYGVTACQGDSGGPLTCLTQDGYTLAGISSWGDVDCGDYPSIYTQVAENLGWIHDVMDFHGSN